MRLRLRSQEEESCSPPQAALRATRRGASSATMAAPPAMTRLLPRPVINQSPVPLHLRLTRREMERNNIQGMSSVYTPRNSHLS
jgi:hypothetical protein